MDVLSEVFNIPKMICASATTQEEERRCERKGSSVKERERVRESRRVSEGVGRERQAGRLSERVDGWEGERE